MAQRPLDPAEATTPVATRLTASVLDRLERLAAARGVRRSDLVREAIGALLDDEGAPQSAA